MFMRNTRLHQLEEQVSSLQNQLDSIARHLGIVPTPPRQGWQRYSSPINRLDIDTAKTLLMSAVKPDPSIADITIDQYGWLQAYAKDGRKLPHYCGPAAYMGPLLERCAPHIPRRRWLTIHTIGSRPVSAPETPIPATHRNLV